MDCPARGQAGKGNIVIHSQKERRYKCKQCGQTFAATKGTAFYRRRTPSEVMVLVLTLLAHGCPVQAIVAAFGFDERTVVAWEVAFGQQLEGVQRHLVQQGRDLGQVQADELRIKQQGGVVWLAMAIAVSSRLWLGGVVSARRDSALISRVMEIVRACALVGPLLICVDGFKPYPTIIRKLFREPVRVGRRGPMRRIGWPELLIGQVVKQKAGRRVIGLRQQLVHGPEQLLSLLIGRTQGHGHLNTAYIERLNATFRARLAPLTRRTRALGRCQRRLHASIYLIGTVYNFCCYHESLSLPAAPAGPTRVHRTPAMAAGITDHRWSVLELLSFRVPPPRWLPPKRRGKRSKQMLRLIAQWCS